MKTGADFRSSHVEEEEEDYAHFLLSVLTFSPPSNTWFCFCCGGIRGVSILPAGGYLSPSPRETYPKRPPPDSIRYKSLRARRGCLIPHLYLFLPHLS